MKKDFLFTSESISEGHPDKVCDQISDAILDVCLEADPDSKVACETLVKTGMVVIAGEITSKANINYDQITRQVLRDIGYNNAATSFDAESCAILTHVSQQSPDIFMGVSENEGTFKEQGAGDQGLMFGFACDHTDEFMPLPISLSHDLMFELSKQRKDKVVDFLGPDSKAQVSVEFKDGKPQSVNTVVISTMHSEDIELTDLQKYVTENVVKKVIPAKYLTAETRYLINPTGRFVLGGPLADAGLTGRKIIADTYGGYSRHGGGAFSGKDPSKVDRSAAYAARYMAKNIVAAGIATNCEVQLAYAIGVAEPVSILVDTFGTSKVDENKIEPIARELFPLTPRAIAQELKLKQPMYLQTAAYGHFGRKATEKSFTWEKTDKVEALKAALL